ncbi:hypothetical protein [Candidatus Marinarcus aquaticus]|uniref:Uncharacterized protein n=1 Tax=Candidatus Marinarcus aquaticus TaxID=2044504 RepID=A0A4Q0XR38_9BACT|nr:hypothetical protein [Candidatus Marinarcus aquaticus]RXJ55328.1 hypothetical protein CRV04_10865 [Candidatus Marinarcus aquaticus]
MSLKAYVKQNAPWIYEYINTEVLKGIGSIHPNYFIKVIEDLFIKQEGAQITQENNTPNLFPYRLFTFLFKQGKMDYTSFRNETISLSPLTLKASVYHNYVHFWIHEDTFYIDLMQTKMGGMPLDEDIVKYSKAIPIQKEGLEEFITAHKHEKLNASLQTIKEKIEEIL